MDDTYKINEARTEMREAYVTGDAARLLTVFHSDGFIDMSEGKPNRYGREARQVLSQDSIKLFASYHVKFFPIVVQIGVNDAMAFDRGWLEFTLTPKVGGEPIRKRYRFVDLWKRVAGGDWKIAVHITNMDIPELVNGVESSWFLSELGTIPSVPISRD